MTPLWKRCVLDPEKSSTAHLRNVRSIPFNSHFLPTSAVYGRRLHGDHSSSRQRSIAGQEASTNVMEGPKADHFHSSGIRSVCHCCCLALFCSQSGNKAGWCTLLEMWWLVAATGGLRQQKRTEDLLQQHLHVDELADCASRCCYGRTRRMQRAIQRAEGAPSASRTSYVPNNIC